MSQYDLTKLPNLRGRVASGWTLEVKHRADLGKYHAQIWHGYIGNSHNHLGATETEALENLEKYVQSPAAEKWDSDHK